MLDLIIREARIADASDIYEAEIGVKDEKIVQISKKIAERADREIKAKGRLLLPGGIDGHSHYKLPFGGTFSADDYENGTKAAAFGGITTGIDFAYPRNGSPPFKSMVEWRKRGDSDVVIDYTTHSVITGFDEKTPFEIKKLFEYGVISYKLYMTYRKEGLMVDDGVILEVFKEVRRNGGIVGVHCENNSIIEHLQAKFLSEGKTSAKYHAKSRPDFVEGEAAERVIRLAQVTEADVYVAHTSTKYAVESVKAARERGQHVYAETVPHYLIFTDDVYERKDAMNFVMSPCIKGARDREGLWQGLAAGLIHTVGSDHCPFDSKQKAMGKNDFTKIPNGVPGTEVIIPILYSEGVGKNRITLNQLVRVTSYNPAKIFGLYPRKGTIDVGSDADFVIIDPKKRVRLSADNLHTKIDYSIYDNLTVTGYPVMTISRGEVICEDGQFLGKKGRGRWLKTNPYPKGYPELN